MDVRPYKHAPPARHEVRGLGLLAVHPLSPSEYQRAVYDAELRFEEAGAAGAQELEVERVVQLLARACRVDAGELISALYPAELSELVGAWSRAQERATPDIDRLRGWLRRRVNDDPEIMMDGAAAYNAESAVEYFGRPLSELTRGQVAYFLLLRSAFEEWHVPDHKGRTKKPTKQWLKSDA